MKANHPFRTLALAILFISLGRICLHAQTELIVDGGFESGGSSWVLSGGAGVYSFAGYPHSGSRFLYLGGVETEIDSGYQTITIPATATSATLSFYYNIFSDEDPSAPFDTFSATIQTPAGSVLATVCNKSNQDKDPAPGNPYYHLQTFDLTPYAGQTVRVQFDSANDDT